MMQRDGTLSTPEGFPVLGADDKPIKLASANNIQVSTDGTISATNEPWPSSAGARGEPGDASEGNDTRFVADGSTKLLAAKDVTVTRQHRSIERQCSGGLNELITVSALSMRCSV